MNHCLSSGGSNKKEIAIRYTVKKKSSVTNRSYFIHNVVYVRNLESCACMQHTLDELPLATTLNSNIGVSAEAQNK